MAIFKREIFLNIGKTGTVWLLRAPRKKEHWFTNLTFVLPHYGKANY
jgi:hypothetical protein